MMSLRLRLLLGAIVGIALALTIAGFILVAAFEAHVRSRYVEQLDSHLHQLAALVQIDADGAVSLRHELYDATFQQPLSGLYWQIKDGSTVALRSKSLWDNALAMAGGGPNAGQRQVIDVIGPRKQTLIAVERRVVVDGHNGRPLRLVLAGEIRAIAESRDDFISTVVYSLAVIGGLLVLASWFQVGTGLSPLGGLRRQLAELRQGRLERLDGRYPDEIANLVEDLNRLLTAQSREVERARANAGKLGHGLKTPLAVLAAECRGLRGKGEAVTAEAIEQEIDEMNAHIARVIAAARAIGPRKAIGTSTPLQPVIQRITDVMKRLPRGGEIDWRVVVTPPDLSVAVDRRDLEELLGNLLDNARKWARGQVVIAAIVGKGSVDITIDDDGPGIPEERRDDVLAGGFRLDRTVPGTGIGLAIASDLALLHGGGLRIGPGALGGTQVAVSIATTAGSP